MYIFFFNSTIDKCLCDWHTEGTEGEAIIICLKIYKERIIYFGEKKKHTVIPVINS